MKQRHFEVSEQQVAYCGRVITINVQLTGLGNWNERYTHLSMVWIVYSKVYEENE